MTTEFGNYCLKFNQEKEKLEMSSKLSNDILIEIEIKDLDKVLSFIQRVKELTNKSEPRDMRIPGVGC